MLKTPIIESYPRTKLSQSKQLNRSKVTSHFSEEFKRKSEDDLETVLVNKILEVVKWNRDFKEYKEQE